MRTTRRDVLKTAALTFAATSLGIGIGGYANATTEAASDDMLGATAGGMEPCPGAGLRSSEIFDREAQRIYERHWRQTNENVEALRKRYEKPVLGRVRVWDAVQKLAFCVDRADTTLYCTNQLIHVEQVLASMALEHADTPEMVVAAVIHDLGKIMRLAGEAPENVFCANRPIGEFCDGCGLDGVLFQWNHDEFIYTRVKDYVPEHLAWLVRYHSLDLRHAGRLMNPRDLELADRYLAPFHRFDTGSKSVHALPPRGTLDRYRDVIEEAFPRPILI